MAEAEANAITLKLPPYWPADPELWFAQVEAQFATRHVTTDGTKYSYLVASLTPESAAEVRDLLITPPDTDRYKGLKEALVKRTTNSEQARIKQLLTTEELDGRRPTQLLRRMRQLVGSNTALVPEDLLKQIFVPRLPNHVQLMLTAHDSLTLDKCAELADKLMDVIGPQVSALTPSPMDDVAVLRKELNEIKDLLRGRSNDKQTAGPRSRSKTPGPRSEDQPGYCWYHAKFGDKAKHCRPGCTFRPENANSSH